MRRMQQLLGSVYLQFAVISKKLKLCSIHTASLFIIYNSQAFRSHIKPVIHLGQLVSDASLEFHMKSVDLLESIVSLLTRIASF